MTEAIRHRGPDDAGVWIDADAGIGLGSRRLSILDLSPSGHMPMCSASGRFVLTYNGEIYNFAELRAELDASGRSFRGHSDTEVLIESIDWLGLDTTLSRIAGMFAFALWDRQTKTLTLVRDRLGEKPLYWGDLGSVVLFGSELRALRAHPLWRGEIDRDALALFLRYGYIPAPHSIYRQVRKVLPGTTVTFSSDEALPRERAYWSVRSAAEHGEQHPFAGDEGELLDSLEQKLHRTIKEEMVADVPLGAFLSGGIDSTTIVALMQQHSSRPVRTFTIGFHERDFDEAAHARAIAAHLRTDHTELYATPAETLATIPQIPAVYDEPFADPSQIPTMLVAKLARRYVTVSLSGDGGDELFGGYPRYQWSLSAWSRLARTPSLLRRNLARAIIAAPAGTWNIAARLAGPLLPARLRAPGIEPKLRVVADWLAAISQEELYLRQMSHWARPDDVVEGAAEPRTVLSNANAWPPLTDSVGRMACVDQLTYLPDDILVKLDRASMSVGLEARAPFLDHRIVEHALSLPMRIRAGDGGKQILKRLLARYVPSHLTERPKMGFGIPLDKWLRGPLRPWAEDLLNPDLLARDGFIRSLPVRRRWAEHLSEAYDHGYALWNVLMFQAWVHQ